MRGMLLSCGLAFALLAVANGAIINCYVSAPAEEFPWVPPELGLPAIVRAFNDSGVAYTECSQVYLSYRVATQAPGVFKTFAGWVFGGSTGATIGDCETATAAQLNQLSTLYNSFGTVMHFQFSGSSCCATNFCNDPVNVAFSGATQQRPALWILMSALLGIAILRTLWL